MGLGVFSGYSQSCNVELSVEKNRNTKSADESGAEFWMVLKNTSSSSASYDLSALSLEESCATKNKMTSAANVKLDVNILSQESNSLAGKGISLKAGQTYKFKVFVTVPKGTKYGTWSCIEVKAKSSACKQDINGTMLRVFVPDPSEG
ncbi:hypothetical protein GCM10008083_28540 [Ulvibacter litoralis]|nr:hypothetical protein GCM10008083_28540 [Ulvibacter litoralis]